MDPLSMTAGIIAVVGAGNTIGKGLAKVIALRHAPDILLALNNEIIDLAYVVHDIDGLLKKEAEISGTTPPSSLHRALDNSRQNLTELEQLVLIELTTIKGKKNEAKLDRSVWLRTEPKVRELKDKIRDDRLRLSTALSVLASSWSIDTNLQMRRLCLTVETFEIQSSSTSKATAQPLPSYESGQYRDRELSIEADQISGYPSPFPNKDRAHSLGQTISRSWPQSGETGSTSSTVFSNSRSYVKTLDLVRSSCSPSCSCSCHREQCLKSPEFLRGILGSLFIRYTAMPWSLQRCDDRSCRQRLMRISYTFPLWFWDRAVYVLMTNSQGPEMCLRIMRVRPMTDGIFRAIIQERGNRHLKRMLEEGTASVLDVDPEDNTALQIAVRHRKWDCVELFIHEGADRHYSNTNGLSAFVYIWMHTLTRDSGLGFQCPESLKDVFNDKSQLEQELGFPALHQAYLGISSVAFDKALLSTSRCEIDETDLAGRTLLSWAAARGDNATIDWLLRSGASPIKRDMDQWWTPLHWACWNQNLQCIQTLVAAKVNVHARDRYGNTVLQIAVQYGDQPMTIEVLLNRGANIESHDMDGFTILHTAAYTSRPKCLTYLLEAGANINAAITGGSTAIDLAIQGNKHEALRVLIAHIRHHSSSGTPYGRLVFVHAAFWGDIETLENSKACAFSDADIKATYNGWTAVELAKWRRDFNEAWSKKCLQPPDEDPQEWYAAFEELLNGVVKAQREAEDEHSSRDFVEEEASSCEENSDEESVDNVEAQEVWEDARESPH